MNRAANILMEETPSALLMRNVRLDPRFEKPKEEAPWKMNRGK
jgi:hypothetical protein